jgi:arsenate reductase
MGLSMTPANDKSCGKISSSPAIRKVLFVCIENARRSQMAEALFNKLAKGQAVASSAGARPASKVDPKAIEVMKEIGIDISKQRPKSLTMKMVEEADVVVTMGCGANVCPVIPKRVEEWRIEDPAGKPMQIFRKVRNEIKERVERLVETLKNADR